jgi:hypothetical protein
MSAEVYWKSTNVARHFLLRPGESRDLTMVVGKGLVQLDLQPPALLGDGISFELEMPPTVYRGSVSFDKEENFTAALAARDYIVHLPDGREVPLSVRVGEKTTLRVEIATVDVEFRLGGMLAQRFGGDAKLSLDALAESAALASLGIARQPSLDDLLGDSSWPFIEGAARVNVPAGAYQWRLQAVDLDVRGYIDLRRPNAPIVLSDDAMPGLARLDVHVIAAWQAGLRTGRHSRIGDATTMTDERLGGWCGIGHNQWIVWAPTGPVELIVSDKSGAEFVTTSSTPGSCELDLSMPMGNLRVINDDWKDPHGTHRLSVSANGQPAPSRTIGTAANSELVMKLPAGTISVFMNYGGPNGYDYTFVGELTEAGRTVKLSEFAKTTPAEGKTVAVEIHLITSGPRSTLGETLPEDVRASLRRVDRVRSVLLRHDGVWQQYGVGREFWAQWSTGELRDPLGTYELAPGRYRFEAWPGAPAKYCREFEVKDKPLMMELSLD